MTPDDQSKHWLVRPGTIRGLWIVFGVILTGLVLADFLIHPHGVFGVDASFAFYAWYGLTTCMAMVLVAKALGVLLKRSDDYYQADARGDDSEGEP